jgi:methyl acetate hydrolase
LGCKAPPDTAFAINDVDLYPDVVKKWGLSFLINTARTPEGRSPDSAGKLPFPML